MPLMELAMAPGVDKDNTRYSARGRWTDSDMVRFRDGRPESIGGWTPTTAMTYLGTARALLPWSDAAANALLGIGTHLKYYLESGGANFDITPIRSSVVVANPFSTTNLFATVVVTVAAHGAYANDYVTFSGAAAVGGLTLNAEYQIVAVLTANTFTITAGSAATSSAVGGGAAVTAAFQINTGLDTVVYGTGWGAGTWGGMVGGVGTTGWGSAAPVTASGAQLRLWSHDTYGEDLVFNVRDGGLYYWSPSYTLAGRGVPLSSLGGAADVPLVARQVIVSNADRKVFAFGCTEYGTSVQDRMLIRWSSTAAPEMWTPLETNTAGGVYLASGSEFVGALWTRTEILAWTDSALHSLQYIGAPLEYSVALIAAAALAGPNAAASVADVVYWMGDRSFFRYDGRVEPIPGTVDTYVFGDLNLMQAAKIIAGGNAAFNEVWWFYPSAASEENNRYVAYNYVEKLWFVGALARTAWVDRQVEDYPRATSTGGRVYYHEYGQDDGSANPAAAIETYIESGVVEMGTGDAFGFAWRLLPDVTFGGSGAASPSVTMTLTAQDYPGGGVTQTKAGDTTRTATIPVEAFTTQTQFRLRGRGLTLRVASGTLGTKWRLGTPRIDVRADGGRG